jgi:aerobic-type carbon monoxide dehydrogenase small subunit (CoxS/CutS family)
MSGWGCYVAAEIYAGAPIKGESLGLRRIDYAALLSRIFWEHQRTMNRKTVSVRVNGTEHHAEVKARTTLLDMVRDQLGLTGAKLGCDIQVCGACTLLLNGKPISACSVLAIDADGCEVLTIEGLEADGKLDPIQEAFMEFGALQCGYCTSGFILTAKALLDECPNPSDEQIRNYLAGNFCRCGCYQEIIQAVKNVAGSG